MAETPVTGVRIPADILAQIDRLAGGKGKRSEVIISLLRQALGMEGLDAATILDRIDALEKKVGDMASRLNIVEQHSTELGSVAQFVKQPLQDDREGASKPTQASQHPPQQQPETLPHAIAPQPATPPKPNCPQCGGKVRSEGGYKSRSGPDKGKLLSWKWRCANSQCGQFFRTDLEGKIRQP